MKNADAKPEDDELRPEYDPSMLKGCVRGKHLARYRAGTNLAVLTPDMRAAYSRRSHDARMRDCPFSIAPLHRYAR